MYVNGFKKQVFIDNTSRGLKIVRLKKVGGCHISIPPPLQPRQSHRIDLIVSFRLVLSSMRFLRCTGRRVQPNDIVTFIYIYIRSKEATFFFSFFSVKQIEFSIKLIRLLRECLYTRGRIRPNGASRLNNILPILIII